MKKENILAIIIIIVLLLLFIIIIYTNITIIITFFSSLFKDKIWTTIRSLTIMLLRVVTNENIEKTLQEIIVLEGKMSAS